MSARRLTSRAVSAALSRLGKRIATFWTGPWRADELERERSRLSTVIDHSDVAILAVDARGKVVTWNAAMAELTGLPGSSAMGRRVDDLFTLTDEDGDAVSIAERPRGSARLTSTAGRSRWVEFSSSAMPAGTAPKLLTAVFVDKSAKRQLEYTRHLVLASIHHELHGPLTMIRGHAQLLEPTVSNESSAESLEAIAEAVDMMQHVIADLVSLVDDDRTERPTTTAEPTEVKPLVRRTLLSLPSVGGAHRHLGGAGRRRHGRPRASAAVPAPPAQQRREVRPRGDDHHHHAQGRHPRRDRHRGRGPGDPARPARSGPQAVLPAARHAGPARFRAGAAHRRDADDHDERPDRAGGRAVGRPQGQPVAAAGHRRQGGGTAGPRRRDPRPRQRNHRPRRRDPRPRRRRTRPATRRGG
ncbi:PAS domain S-box protein [Actinomadura madurae]|nr:histidine kinase dimerization/phospho-acceptor domain-containing protein [Actinomadura madurae]MCQ0017163.1 PAS domain S-box protein [Actinomadura madurae]